VVVGRKGRERLEECCGGRGMKERSGWEEEGKERWRKWKERFGGSGRKEAAGGGCRVLVEGMERLEEVEKRSGLEGKERFGVEGKERVGGGVGCRWSERRKGFVISTATVATQQTAMIKPSKTCVKRCQQQRFEEKDVTVAQRNKPGDRGTKLREAAKARQQWSQEPKSKKQRQN